MGWARVAVFLSFTILALAILSLGIVEFLGFPFLGESGFRLLTVIIMAIAIFTFGIAMATWRVPPPNR